ncbi:transcription repressor OFP6-like [Rhodamnia argentea]|uniref:Transcription repressor n=1 Tax=Rhodamnia argentea TaxID=178133 RepID=A0A8B8NFT0_9MYRT|nr:transcription repressor OFP6-like [Rhodamnia argentea]
MASKGRRKKKKKLFFPFFLANLVCSGCARPNASKAAHQRPDHASCQEFPGFYGSEDDNYESARISLHASTPPRLFPGADDHWDDKPAADVMYVVSPCRKITNSVAMAKESEDPYEDFKRSMLQMVFEKEIHSKHDLRELLNCFLQLNPPAHHDVISRAFAEIWNDVVSKKTNKGETRIGMVSCFT